MDWAIFLHFYQPSNQHREVIENVVETAYRPILSLLERYESARVSININACLTEQLEEHGFDDVLHNLRKLASAGKIIFVASVRNHAFLPLIPEYEIEWQIKKGQEINQAVLGDLYRPRGFFPTELAVSHRVAKAVEHRGFAYLLADEISFGGSLGNKRGFWSRRHTAAGTDRLGVFFANRRLCDLIRGTSDLRAESFRKALMGVIAGRSGGDRGGEGSYIVSAHDAEAFGHHYASRYEILEWIFKHSASYNLRLVTLDDLYDRLTSSSGAGEEVELVKGTWETTEADLQAGRPFPLWYDPNNAIQQAQWQLAWKAIESFHRAKKHGEDIDSEAFRWARSHLSHGLPSCYFWWASCRPWWNPDMIVAGATELIKVIRTLNSLEPQDKSEAEEGYVRIIHLVWQWHWSGEAQRRMTALKLQTPGVV